MSCNNIISQLCTCTHLYHKKEISFLTKSMLSLRQDMLGMIPVIRAWDTCIIIQFHGGNAKQLPYDAFHLNWFNALLDFLCSCCSCISCLYQLRICDDAHIHVPVNAFKGSLWVPNPPKLLGKENSKVLWLSLNNVLHIHCIVCYVAIWKWFQGETQDQLTCIVLVLAILMHLL